MVRAFKNIKAYRLNCIFQRNFNPWCEKLGFVKEASFLHNKFTALRVNKQNNKMKRALKTLTENVDVDIQNWQ